MGRCPLQLLSKGELLAQFPRGLQADWSIKIQQPTEWRYIPSLQDRNAIAANNVQQRTQDKTKATQREHLPWTIER